MNLEIYLPFPFQIEIMSFSKFSLSSHACSLSAEEGRLPPPAAASPSRRHCCHAAAAFLCRFSSPASSQLKASQPQPAAVAKLPKRQGHRPCHAASMPRLMPAHAKPPTCFTQPVSAMPHVACLLPCPPACCFSSLSSLHQDASLEAMLPCFSVIAASCQSFFFMPPPLSKEDDKPESRPTAPCRLQSGVA